jgi:hypothetical protein
MHENSKETYKKVRKQKCIKMDFRGGCRKDGNNNRVDNAK